MAEWSKNKVEPSNINGGQEYTLNDNVSLEELNAIANNSFYASDTANTANTNAHNAVETANEALEQARSTGTRVIVGGEFQSTFDADSKVDKKQTNKNYNMGTDTNGNVVTQDFIILGGDLKLSKEVDTSTGEVSFVIEFPEED